MAALVTVERVCMQLRLPVPGSPAGGSPADDELSLIADEASEIVLARIAKPADATWTALLATWTEVTVPAAVRTAVLYQCANLYGHRGDEGMSGPAGIAPEAEALLKSTGYLDPPMA